MKDRAPPGCQYRRGTNKTESGWCPKLNSNERLPGTSKYSKKTKINLDIGRREKSNKEW